MHHTINPLILFSSKRLLLSTLLSSISILSHATDPITATNPSVLIDSPLPIAAAPVANTASTTASTQPLPNAYELLQRLEAQQIEMARLAGQIETLQYQITQLNTNNLSDNTLSGSDTLSKQTLKETIKTELNTDIEQMIADEVARQVKLEMATIEANMVPRRPYLTPPKRIELLDDNTPPTLLTNTDIPKGTFSTSENTMLANIPAANKVDIHIQTANSKRQGELAYAAAYTALKNESVEAGIQKMQTFIATYTHHDLIPNAHYWLGEFYLKQSPPNVVSAAEQFYKVVTEFKDNPNNTKQTKALYRLATFAKNNNDSVAANNYIKQLLANYPESAEAKLAKQSDW